MSNDEKRDVRTIVRSYEKDGEIKNIYQTIGTAWVSEHGSKVTIQLETMPIIHNWNGKCWADKPYEKKDDTPMPQEKVMEAAFKDNLPNDEDGDKPIDLSAIQF